MPKPSQRIRRWFDYRDQETDQRLTQVKGKMIKMTPRAAPSPSQVETFESPDSSTIAKAEYDRSDNRLSVWFKRKSGSPRYDYRNIPLALWEAFKEAESKGIFFSQQIRPVYDGTLVQ